MSIETICGDINFERITFGTHLIQRMWQNGISIDQVLDTILTGIVNKKENDESSYGKFNKFTISKDDIVVVVKDCNPAFIITANRR
ncbi:hypothetical protein AUJ95_01265 [Candidatus Desantisbacteria bacterium CG2_30_40_21]|uniref:DUF4258 domain-containing protein n=4 Tax=unclassified Candidatus Desantisiibacteriota TaxID=3106372 RepID=A0A2M7J8L3_9BACT|nr:MAG: hypothetical protein AUJ95_01265 [Candidatus Desantisbacteria bacterium CG2_30_40_21]PIP40589.1 MAG: hypothetical protein COX18_06245 [Candidatus Desantisbacteria bacterium CG23_combo_of_CG06-09_8_20_14_all_40_23]PIX15723.1 MAG: hypothetical protein COZ71_09660 [Candidatus Desantisbacteria bacterium CG_4_8_14_3_um_filter_40_12]PIY19766.1 MAG: hypothetical protein COZ13_03650 [Candidatus Desantisbacteria bacterium CG_4_10_14_3_um_filter_40_18]